MWRYFLYCCTCTEWMRVFVLEIYMVAFRLKVSCDRCCILRRIFCVKVLFEVNSSQFFCLSCCTRKDEVEILSDLVSVTEETSCFVLSFFGGWIVFFL